jgi:ribosomal protein L16 Arg81 hydroxylase
LQPGDLLFLPAGYWHHCENGPERSLHLGIFLIPPTYLHVVKAVTSKLVADERFRLPLTRIAHASELAELEADLKKSVIEEIKRLELQGFLSETEEKKAETIT